MSCYTMSKNTLMIIANARKAVSSSVVATTGIARDGLGSHDIQELEEYAKLLEDAAARVRSRIPELAHVH